MPSVMWLAANVLALAELIPLTIRYGDPLDVVTKVAGNDPVHIAAETTPYGHRRDEAIGEKVRLVATGSAYAVGPGLITNGTGDPYQVFSAAWRRWHAFRDGGLDDYLVERDRPDHDGTSRLSPYFHLGVLHPRSLLAELDPASTYATELAWREFCADRLDAQPGPDDHRVVPDQGPARVVADRRPALPVAADRR